MFSKTSTILVDDKIVLFNDSACIGNKALYLLIGSRIDGYFQCATKQFEGAREKALALIKL
jgi:hypothetical protein